DYPNPVGVISFTFDVDGVSYYEAEENVVFHVVPNVVPVSYVVNDLEASIQPSNEEGGVLCEINREYECNFEDHILTLTGSVDTNAFDILPEIFSLKVTINAGDRLEEYEVNDCQFNENLEFTCGVPLQNLGNVPYISSIGLIVSYGSGDHISEEIGSFTFPLVIPQELIDLYSNVSFHAELTILDDGVYKRVDDTVASLPVCIIPVSVGRYWEEYNAQQGEVPAQQIWDSLRDNYGYGNINYDQPLCSFAGESIGVIVYVPELYHVDDFELNYIGYSLGNARDFSSATCVPLSSNDEYISRYKYGETGITFYCVLPNIEYLMDDFAGVMPEIESIAEVPLYIKLAIRDGQWDRQGEYVVSFQFLIENSYGALNNKLDSLEAKKEYLEQQKEEINKISKRSSTAAMAVAGLDYGFGAKAIDAPVLEYLSIARFAKCSIGCKIFASGCGPHGYAACYHRCQDAAGSGGSLGRAETSSDDPTQKVVYNFCWGIIDYSFVCTLGGSLLLSGAMVNSLEKIEAEYDEITTEIYDVEDRLKDGEDYGIIREELDETFDPYAENSYHRSFLMELNPTVTKLAGSAFAAACAYGKLFGGFTSLADEITMNQVAAQFARNFVSSGINAWVYGEKLTTAVAGAASATAIDVGVSSLSNVLEGSPGSTILNLFSKGSVLVGLWMAAVNRPDGMTTTDAVLFYWGAWSFSEGTAALGQFAIEFGSTMWERWKLNRVINNLPPEDKRDLNSLKNALEREGYEVEITTLTLKDERGKDININLLIVKNDDSEMRSLVYISDNKITVGSYRTTY
ncbi:MAG: hypothetical protein GXN99_02895, partial [Candidatus Nanohaloarchaeota archaeon]|nr:hypothetical protein [Candidatus Nanohaloarchaeota archaeon]